MVLMPEISTAHSATKIWPVLVDRAINYGSITYGRLQDLTGVRLVGFNTSKALPLISRHCQLNNIPNLAALVVLQSTGIPGEGFFPEGLNIENGMTGEQRLGVMEAQKAVLEAVRPQVYGHRWLDATTPTLGSSSRRPP